MNRTQKETLVSRMQDKLKRAHIGVVADYTGINVASINKLRKDLRGAKANFFVAKNTILKRALKDTPFSELDKYLDGPTSVALHDTDPVILAKALIDYGKTEQHLKIKGAIFEGKMLGADEVKKIASLPSREVLLSMLLSAMQSPYRKLVYVLNGTISKFVNVMSQISKSKETPNK